MWAETVPQQAPIKVDADLAGAHGART